MLGLGEVLCQKKNILKYFKMFQIFYARHIKLSHGAASIASIL